MNDDPLEALLERLNQGDPAAAEQAFLAYEPYLRMVVRRQLSGGLRAKFDSADIVQSAWADVLDGFREREWSFRDASHLRAFLVKVTRNRLVDRIRQHRTAVEREQVLDSAIVEAAQAEAARPSQQVQADELWSAMLDLCPEGHRDVLNMKRQGLAPAEIAVRTGLHPSSVRRIFYDLARRLAGRRSERAAKASS